MKVLYFGSYNKEYSRNRIIIRGLKENNIEVFECNYKGSLFSRYYKLIKGFMKHRKYIDSMVVGFVGHTDVPLAFLLGGIFKKRVLFDIFTSKYETYVEDRKEFSKKQLIAKLYFFVDWLSMHLADFVIADTFAHKEYFCKTFGIKGDKCLVVYLGSDDKIFYPVKGKEDIDVLFYGYYQPLHGVMNIVKAAEGLPSLTFTLIGYGQDKKEVEQYIKDKRIKNVSLLNAVSLRVLSKKINSSKIILGIFGSSEKANCVIPNKVYDGLACRKAVITGRTRAIKEVFEEGRNIVTNEINSPKSLGKSIENIMKNKDLRKSIADEGYRLYKRELTPKIVVRSLLKYL